MKKELLLVFSSLLLIVGCQREEDELPNPVPLTAPDEQERYNQVGPQLETRVTTQTFGGVVPETVVTNPALQNIPEELPAPVYEMRPYDKALAERVRVAIATGSTGTTGIIPEQTLPDIFVTAQDGVVTLRGSVVSAEEKNRIEGQVEDMQGVRRVINLLVVGDPSVPTEGRFPVPKFEPGQGMVKPSVPVQEKPAPNP